MPPAPLSDPLAPGDHAGERLTHPRWRGRSHLLAFAAWVLASPWVLMRAPQGWPRGATLLYVVAIAGLFGVSALYHVPRWGPPMKRRLRRLDHASIFLTVAGTYTAVAGIALTGGWRTTLLAVVWTGAIAGIVLAVAWIDAPTKVHATAYVALGWVAVASLPALWESIGPGGVGLLVAGGVLYTVGALVYARRRPDPWPATFGYHEIFHLFVIAAVLTHCAVIVAYVLGGA